MKRIFRLLTIITVIPLIALAGKGTGPLKSNGFKVSRMGDQIYVTADLILDSLRLGGNRQIYVTPVIEGPEGKQEAMPTLLINGRNMHYAYKRGSMPKNKNLNYNVAYEVERHNGKSQTFTYKENLPMKPWMLDHSASLRMLVDSCGCGRPYASSAGDPRPLNLNPAPRMRLAYITPKVTELPVAIHEGRARVQFEVDRTELHDRPYVCRNGQRIDNRGQLKIIHDSIRYALADPNVEIARVDICGYASPESPYLHNEQLATNRSRSLAEYIGEKYNLPREACTYGSVPENWGEFRELAANSDEITEKERADLLELIDRPAYGASDYDAKERELKTSPKFSGLYRSLILPKWFPLLRATQFQIRTRLKPLSDKQLAEVIRKTPQLMNLNQMFRVARLYPEGSREFNEVIETARKYYPTDETANLNAAVAAISNGEFDKAEELLSKAGDTPEANNARGVLATHNGDFAKATEFFRKAGNLPEAEKNANMISY